MTKTQRHSQFEESAIILGHKLVRGTQKHRTGFSWVSGGTLDFSGAATLEALDPAELD